MSSATMDGNRSPSPDGKDEKVEPNFSSFNALPANINLKKIIKVSAAWFNVFFMTL